MRTREETDPLTQDVHVLSGKHSVLFGVACLRLNGCEPVSWISVSFPPPPLFVFFVDYCTDN